MKSKSKILSILALSTALVAPAMAAAPDLTSVGTEGITGVAAGASAGMPVAAALLAVSIAILVFKKIRRAGS